MQADEAAEHVEKHEGTGPVSPHLEAARALLAEVRRLREQSLNYREGFERESAWAEALRQQVTDLTEQLQSAIEQGAREAEEMERLREVNTGIAEQLTAAIVEMKRLREENARMKQTLEICNTVAAGYKDERDESIRRHSAALDDLEEMSKEPRYSTEAVDALLKRYDGCFGDEGIQTVDDEIEAVRASREPRS